MDFIKYTEKLESLQYYIRSGSAVTRKSLAEKLNVSKRTVCRMIDTLRVKGINVHYSKVNKKYMLSND
jgi:predicted DNA-binding transcriptional regulator YafY